MILHGKIVEQVVDWDAVSAFQKEIVVTSGSVPLAMVRKRDATPGSAGGNGGTLAPVLLVHGFGQNRYAWHLPARSLSNYLARGGFDVFNLDLRGHGRSRHLGARRCGGIDDYVRDDLPAAVEEVQRLSGKRRVWIVGHSLGGLVAYAAAPRLDGAVAGLVSLGSPYHLSRGSLTLGALAFFFRALAIARLPNAPLPLAPVGLTMSLLRRFAESPLYPLPLRGWHAGSLEPHVLEQHFRLAFDRAALAEMTDSSCGARRAASAGGTPTTWSGSREWTCRCSSSRAPTTTSRLPRQSAPGSRAADPATRRTARCPSATSTCWSGATRR